ncbi:alpha-N-acetylglucosaminidase isoform X2 [Paramormyrops kingsleyae]|uniref:alpha-N-acetylglucosaminidase isoform X2 n=1 Tax=Paramormyrops kingsleyae TaxID=1676925 RepID=UPI003B96E8F0
MPYKCSWCLSLPLIAVIYVTFPANCEFPTLAHLGPQASDETQTKAVTDLVKRLLGSRGSEFILLVNRSLARDDLDVCELRSAGGDKIAATGSSGVAVAAGVYHYLKYYCSCQVSWSGSQLSLPSPLPGVPGVLRLSTPHKCTLVLALTRQTLTASSLALRSWPGTAWYRILQRMRALGMMPVLPAFSGIVPKAITRLFPQAKVTKLGPWSNFNCSYSCAYVLEPSDPLFQRIGSLFLSKLLAEFGTDHIYNTDTFNEMTPTSSDPVYLSAVSRSVFASMTSVDSQAIWLMQGWLFVNNPTFWKQEQIKALLHGVPIGRMIVLDLFAESMPVFSSTSSFYGQPFIWCMLHNFGGNSGLFGTVENINMGPFEALRYPNSTLVGLGMAPEGIEQNPVVYELMSELAWHWEPIDLYKWASLYAARRYGVSHENLTDSWKLLFHSVYNCTVPKYKNHNHSPLVRRPTMHMNTDLWYDPRDLYEAWRLMYLSAKPLMSVETFRYDLVDVTRQALQLLTTQLYLEIKDAFQKQNLPKLLTAGGLLVSDLLPELDRLLSSESHFLLGLWLEQARALAQDKHEAEQYEVNARNQITLWGPEGNILDYASKEWGGLMGDYYTQRWSLFVNTLVQCLDRGKPFNQDAFNQAVFQVEKNFTINQKKYPSKPQGDTYDIVTRIFLKYYPKALKRLN